MNKIRINNSNPPPVDVAKDEGYSTGLWIDLDNPHNPVDKTRCAHKWEHMILWDDMNMGWDMLSKEKKDELLLLGFRTRG
jgi:hypothetical protein